MSIPSRQLLLGSILLVTIWLSWNTHGDNENTHQTATTKQASPLQANINAPSFVLEPRQFKLTATNLFSADTKTRPRPAVKAMPQQVLSKMPQAPALPFKYLGRWADSTGSHFFIDVAGEVVSIHADQMITPEYQVIDIKETANAAEIVFLYLPLNEKQTMYIGKNKS